KSAADAVRRHRNEISDRSHPAWFRLPGLRLRALTIPLDGARTTASPHLRAVPSGPPGSDDVGQGVMIRIRYRVGFVLIDIRLLGMGLMRLQTERAGNAHANADYGVVPDVSLVEAGGRQVNLQEFKGKIWIADFIFTSCAGMCPMMTSQMRKLQDALPQDIRL